MTVGSRDTRRREVVAQIPSRKCKAKARRTGEQCRQWAVVGATVCKTHGGRAPQVKALAAQRVTLAQALATGPRRPAWEVLADALHTVDTVGRQVRDKVMASDEVTPDLLAELLAASERAARFAKTVLDAGVDQRRVQLAEAQAGQLNAIFTRILSGLHLNAEQRALVPALVRREVGAELAIEAEVIGDGR